MHKRANQRIKEEAEKKQLQNFLARRIGCGARKG